MGNKNVIIRAINQKIADHIEFNDKIYFDEPINNKDGTIITGVVFDNALVGETGENKISLESFDIDTLNDIMSHLNDEIERDAIMFNVY